MRHARRHGLLALTFLMGAVPATRVRAAAFSSAARGTTGAQFLELPVGGRASGMGTAQAAAVDDATALYYNPGALADLRGGEAVFMHALHFEDISYDYLAAARRMGDLGVGAFSLQYLSPGSLSEVDNTGAPTGGSLSPRDLAATLGFARGLGPVGVGGSVKYISSKIDESASAFAVDLGARGRVGSFSWGGSVVNVGQGLKFRQSRDPLPTTFRVGAAYERERLTLAFDGVAPRGAAPYPAVGAEWRLPLTAGWTAAARGGYAGRLAQSKLGGLTGMTMGVGIGTPRFRFDYALVPYGDLGTTHRLSVDLAWGR